MTDLYTLASFKIGDRVRLHPASDWFMRGIQYATVISIGRKALRCKVDSTILEFKLSPRNVTEIVN